MSGTAERVLAAIERYPLSWHVEVDAADVGELAETVQRVRALRDEIAATSDAAPDYVVAQLNEALRPAA